MSVVDRIASLRNGDNYSQMVYFRHPVSLEEVNDCKEKLKNKLSSAIARAKSRDFEAQYQLRIFHTHLFDFDVVVGAVVVCEEEEL